jgi:hypothetical protein
MLPPGFRNRLTKTSGRRNLLSWQLNLSGNVTSGDGQAKSVTRLLLPYRPSLTERLSLKSNRLFVT